MAACTVGVSCTATKGEHKTGACVRDADGLNHTCGCESGYIGEHCAGAFTISGATRGELNGLYSRTNHTCHGKPVYQKGGSDGYVLFQPSEYLVWMVGSSERATGCEYEATGYLSSQDGSCAASPDGAGCAGKWTQNTDYGDCHARDFHWCTNPNITVVAVSGSGL
jgi:hypothetical protein|eukprot:COSAG01_NODE_196_length_22350_cov_812.929136_26_plen_166_part_00